MSHIFSLYSTGYSWRYFKCRQTVRPCVTYHFSILQVTAGDILNADKLYSPVSHIFSLYSTGYSWRYFKCRQTVRPCVTYHHITTATVTSTLPHGGNKVGMSFVLFVIVRGRAMYKVSIIVLDIDRHSARSLVGQLINFNFKSFGWNISVWPGENASGTWEMTVFPWRNLFYYHHKRLSTWLFTIQISKAVFNLMAPFSIHPLWIP